jgi:ubiquinone/menaquinone biosynthesis C-methylase UbiE
MDYAVIAESMEKIGALCVERAGVAPGMEVLDVGCGTGNAAIPAARLGARVTGLEPWPELLAIARERAADAMVEVDWVQGDPAALPFEDGRFDVVVSISGDPCVDEMRRVCRGRIAMYALTVVDV